MSKHSYFIKFLKKINSNINSLLENYLNKLNFSNFRKNKSKYISSNRVYLTFAVLVILFFSYLSIPHTYNKVETRLELKNQLLEKLNINFIFSNNFKYQFFPRPHFIIKDSAILYNYIKISDVKKLKIYVSLNSLFSLKNITINEVNLENTNFNLNNQNTDFFIKILDNNFTENIFKIKDSKIFYRDNNNQVLFINKIINMEYYFNPNDLQNIIYSENEIFNIPYSYKMFDDKLENLIFTKFNLNLLKFQFENEIDYSDDLKKGTTTFFFNKKKSKAFYEFNDNSFTFDYSDKLTNPSFEYQGSMNFSPFYSTYKGNIDKLNLFTLFKSNSIIVQFLRTGIFNNENLNIEISISAEKIFNYHSFIDILLNFKLKEGLIDIDDTKFSWSKYVNFKMTDSLVYVDNNQLILDGKLIIDIKNYNQIYKFLQTSKNLRPELQKIDLDFSYNFDQHTIDISNVKIDNQNNEKISNLLKKLVLKNNNLQNKIYFKNIIKKAIYIYAG